MFKKLAAEALGISDVGVIIAPADYNKVDADDYLFHEDGEKIYFLIKSKKDEYCFTNFGLTHVDGESAVSSKRTIKRYEFTSHSGDVRLILSGNTGFELDADTFSGSVRSDIPVTLRTVGQTRSGERRSSPRAIRGTYGDASAILSVRSHSGSVIITKK